jgi:hypothetical protein
VPEKEGGGALPERPGLEGRSDAAFSRVWGAALKTVSGFSFLVFGLKKSGVPEKAR